MLRMIYRSCSCITPAGNCAHQGPRLSWTGPVLLCWCCRQTPPVSVKWKIVCWKKQIKRETLPLIAARTLSVISLCSLVTAARRFLVDSKAGRGSKAQTEWVQLQYCHNGMNNEDNNNSVICIERYLTHKGQYTALYEISQTYKYTHEPKKNPKNPNII